MKMVQTACALIYRKTAQEYLILMTRRSRNATFLPGMLELPGGHIEAGETDEIGLKREIREELNLEIAIEHLFDSFTYHHTAAQVIENVYLAQPLSPLSEIVIQASEVDSYLWVREADLNTIVAANKNPNDPEIKILKKCFAYLRSSSNSHTAAVPA